MLKATIETTPGETVADEPFWFARALPIFAERVAYYQWLGSDPKLCLEYRATLDGIRVMCLEALGPILQRARELGAADRQGLQLEGVATAADTRRLIGALGIALRENARTPTTFGDGRMIIVLPASFATDAAEAEALAMVLGFLRCADPVRGFDLTWGEPPMILEIVNDFRRMVATAFAEAWLGRELPRPGKLSADFDARRLLQEPEAFPELVDVRSELLRRQAERNGEGEPPTAA